MTIAVIGLGEIGLEVLKEIRKKEKNTLSFRAGVLAHEYTLSRWERAGKPKRSKGRRGVPASSEAEKEKTALDPGAVSG